MLSVPWRRAYVKLNYLCRRREKVAVQSKGRYGAGRSIWRIQHVEGKGSTRWHVWVAMAQKFKELGAKRDISRPCRGWLDPIVTPGRVYMWMLRVWQRVIAANVKVSGVNMLNAQRSTVHGRRIIRIQCYLPDPPKIEKRCKFLCRIRTFEWSIHGIPTSVCS